MRKLHSLGFVVSSLVCVAPMIGQRLTTAPLVPLDSRTKPPALTLAPELHPFSLPRLQTKPEWTPRPLSNTFSPSDPQLGNILTHLDQKKLQLAENTSRPCFAMRSYKFSADDGVSGLTKPEGITTCVSAKRVHEMTVLGIGKPTP